MPLIVFCGIPSCGKTTRANEIKVYLEENHKAKVLIVNEEALSLKKNESYKDYTTEKMARAFLKSNVEKNLDDSTVVILDSMNYIKGFRYELFCLARTAKTTHCVIFLDFKVETAREYLKSHPEGLNSELFEDYCKRMETPNPKNRWDSPLFNIREGEKTPLEDIAQTILFEEKKSKDPISTKQDTKMGTNFVYELDKRVQDVIETIITKQSEFFVSGMSISFEGCKQKLVISSMITLIELKKLKKEFTSLCKQYPPKSIEDIQPSFISYLETNLSRST